MFRRRRQSGTAELSYPAAPGGAGLVCGRVLDPVAQPLAGAEIALTEDGGRPLLQSRSDPYGTFVASVPPGRYRLAVSADGYQPVRTDVEVLAGHAARIGDLALAVAPQPGLPAAGDWQIDPAHSTVRFTARHIGLARVHGRFNSFSGLVRIGERMTDSAVKVVIDAASIDTGVRQRDDHLRSTDFLDVRHYPTLEFHSNRFVHRGGDRWSLQGPLTLHGVTRTVALDTRYLGTGIGMEGEARVACIATTELHREDFTLNWRQMLAAGIAVVGSSIQVELDIQAIRRG